MKREKRKKRKKKGGNLVKYVVLVWRQALSLALPQRGSCQSAELAVRLFQPHRGCSIQRAFTVSFSARGRVNNLTKTCSSQWDVSRSHTKFPPGSLTSWYVQPHVVSGVACVTGRGGAIRAPPLCIPAVPRWPLDMRSKPLLSYSTEIWDIAISMASILPTRG